MNSRLTTQLEVVLFLDIGYMCTDIGVVQMNNESAKILLSKSSTSFRGQLLDHELLQLCVGKTNQLFDQDVTKNKKAMFRLYQEIKKTRVNLSSCPEVELEIGSFIDGDDFEIDVNRRDFEARLEGHLMQLGNLLTKVYQFLVKNSLKLSKVVLLGGFSYVPVIETTIKSHFGHLQSNQFERTLNAFEEIALGGCISLACGKKMNSLTDFAKKLNVKNLEKQKNSSGVQLLPKQEESVISIKQSLSNSKNLINQGLESPNLSRTVTKQQPKNGTSSITRVFSPVTTSDSFRKVSRCNSQDTISKDQSLETTQVLDCTQNLPNSNLLKYKIELDSLPLEVKELLPREVLNLRLTKIESCETLLDQNNSLMIEILLDELQGDLFSHCITALKETRVLTFFSNSFLTVDDLLWSSSSNLNIYRACLSYCYLKGIGCEKNEGKATSYYNKIEGIENEKNVMSIYWYKEVHSWFSSKKEDLSTTYRALIDGVTLSSTIVPLLPNKIKEEIKIVADKLALIDSQNLDSEPSNALLSECQGIWEGIQRHLDFLSSIKLVTSKFEDLLSFLKSSVFNLVTLNNECNSNNHHQSVLKLFTAFCYAHNLASSPSIENVYRALDDVSLINHFPNQDNELISFWINEVTMYTCQKTSYLCSSFKQSSSSFESALVSIPSTLVNYLPDCHWNEIRSNYNIIQLKFRHRNLLQKHQDIHELNKIHQELDNAKNMVDSLKTVILSPVNGTSLFDVLVDGMQSLLNLTHRLWSVQSHQTKEILHSLLAFCCLKGLGTSQDYLEAGKYYQLLSPLEQESNVIASFWKEEVTKELTDWWKCKSELLEKSRSLQSQSKVITFDFVRLLPNEVNRNIQSWRFGLKKLINQLDYHFQSLWDKFKNSLTILEKEWLEFVSLFHLQSVSSKNLFVLLSNAFTSANPLQSLLLLNQSQTLTTSDRDCITCCTSFCYAKVLV
ncbi:hypothetical protein GEMRC1_003768 [Eukaryota sp. GEM-RC1]